MLPECRKVKDWELFGGNTQQGIYQGIKKKKIKVTSFIYEVNCGYSMGCFFKEFSAELGSKMKKYFGIQMVL